MNCTETDMELIKSFAYGCSAQEAAQQYGISLEEAERKQKQYADDIKKRAAALKEGEFR